MKPLNCDLVMLLRDSECWYDLDACRRAKRRRMCPNGNEKPNYVDSRRVRKRKSDKSVEVLVDQEYKMYLDHIQGIGDLGFADDDDHGHGEDDNDDDDDDDDDVDPDYKMFLDNCRSDGDYYAVEMTKGDGTIVYMRYEEDEDDFGDQGKELSITPQENLKLEASNHGFGDSLPFLSDCKPEMVSLADESYLSYLSNLRIEGWSLIYRTEDCVIKLDEESETKTEGLADNGAPPRIIHEDDDDDCDSVQSISHIEVEASDFAEKLNGEITKPYDVEEFHELWEAARANKNMERSRELRSRCFTYATDMKSLSYLDYHPDVAQMIRQALSRHNKHRALVLLRCLFFYLKNLSQRGAFVPWKNPSTLEMMPRS